MLITTITKRANRRRYRHGRDGDQREPGATRHRPSRFLCAGYDCWALAQVEGADTEALGRNLTMHWGTGIVGGAARALLSERGFRAFQRPLPIWLYGSPQIRCSRTLPVCPRRGRGRNLR